MPTLQRVVGLCTLLWFSSTTLAQTHQPMRPLPAAAQRALEGGKTFFVDAKRGDDNQEGTNEKPWKTLAAAVKKLKPGETVCLRGGVYHEHVVVQCVGEAGKPITIRAYPGELAILDGGLPEFLYQPQTAWEPCPQGVKGEFWSTKTYADLGGTANGVNLLGLFPDSMIPLHGYHNLPDLRSDNPYWNLENKVGRSDSIYCGPGLFFDVTTGRIHCRLAHTKLPGLEKDNYQGESDPRKLPLVVAGFREGSPLALRGAKHVRVFDLTVRGSRTPTVDVFDCQDLEFDGLNVYGGQSAMQVRDSQRFKLTNSALHGIAAPWTFRASLKYRSIEARIFTSGGWEPSGVDNEDFELAHCEFTDCVDGVFVGNVRGVKFHHNLLDNVSDDGIFLTANTAYDGTTPGGNVQIYQNRLSRCLTVFAFGVGHGRQKTIATGKQTGAGVQVFRNVFDFRKWVYYHMPTGPDEPQELTSKGRVAGDHGGPAWEPMTFYHNTVIQYEPPFRNYYGAGWGGHQNGGTARRVFNNIFVQMEGTPAMVLPSEEIDFQADGNLHWSYNGDVEGATALARKFRNSPAYASSKTRYAAGWTTNDQLADPLFLKIDADWHTPLNLGLQAQSPAINAGVELPTTWADPLRNADTGKPDLGALPHNAFRWRIGVNGRTDLYTGEAQ